MSRSQRSERRVQSKEFQKIRTKRPANQEYDEEDGSYDSSVESLQKPKPAAGIDLGGKLNLVYEKTDTLNQVLNLNFLLKGNWNIQGLKNDNDQQSFIYQRLQPPQDEDLLSEYFCE
jgi:hypothetical protein